MKSSPPKPMCFVAMPFGKKSPPGKTKPKIDFDKIYKFIREAVESENLECIRADFEKSGGFIHKPMFERLLVAEYVIADLTLSNPNVTYEVGVRHGNNSKATLLLCAEQFINVLPFDFKPLRVTPYKIGENGNIAKKGGDELKSSIKTWVKNAIAGDLPSDNPILQITSSEKQGYVQHEKTDVFMHRMRYASEIGQRVYDALNIVDSKKSVSELQKIEKELFQNQIRVRQLHSAIISLYIAYREKKAYKNMLDLYGKIKDKELKQTPVIIEQLALALNRISEDFAKEGKHKEAKRFRRDALHKLDELGRKKWTSETYGIAGRIYKGQEKAERQAGNDLAADGALNRAIETYETGFRLDPRDYYPGVNAVTLRISRGSEKDFEALSLLLPAVRYSVDRAPKADGSEESYWQQATKLELACAAKDWSVSNEILIDLLSIDVERWMHETTSNNMEILKRTFSKDKKAVIALNKIIKELNT